MSSLSQWIIVILFHQVVFEWSGVSTSGGADGEHVHIKVHIPEVRRKHTHFRKIQKHVFHPKKIIKAPEYLDAELDTMHKPLNMMPYGMTAQPMQFPSLPLGIGNLPDIPTYGVDNTLEATIMKKPKINSMSHMISEDMFSKFHGMKKASEFLGARPVAEMQRFSSPSGAAAAAAIEDENNEEGFSDEYDAHSTESMIMDQRVAGTMYPNSMTMESPFKPKWQAATYSTGYETAAKPYMKWPSWLSSTTSEDDLTTYEKFPSSTTMYISKARPISSSRPKFEQQMFEQSPYNEAWVMPKKKKSKLSEKRKRTHSPGFRINY
ncbi:uncharacterized protein LOC129952754 [Eupeodes corollae]|uniref:uncharacterized protein LOC129952754 n=1 Tax=Eupeodes corollae TaxID=290404 RepID=UPI0024904D3B|nr:uncharacterized protein LOC129952754 [Eupeodes corollae]